MLRVPSLEMRRLLLTLVASMVSGALAGAIAGWMVVPTVQVPSAVPTTEEQDVSATSTEDVLVIPVDRIPQSLLIPSPFAEHRVSSVASLYRREKGSEGLLTDDQLISEAVAVTSDGWFVVPSVATEALRLSDMLVWHEGVSATPTRAVLDTVGGVTFLKTPLTNLNAPAFARATDVTPGLSTWLERRARRFEPSGIVSLREPLESLDGVSSEQAAREGVAAGRTSAGDLGAPLWSANGALIGLVISKPDEPIRYLPSSAWAASLSSLLSNGEIRHALLGVQTVDLAWARLSEPNPALPVRGAWIRPNRKLRKPAVTPASPAADAGLRDGDVIQRVDRDILDGSSDLGELLADYRPGSRVTLTVWRDGEALELPVELGSIVTSEER